MPAAETEGRSETAAAWRRDIERHPVGSKRLQPPPQPLELRVIDAAAHAAGIDQPSFRIVIAEQQGTEIGPPSFRLAPADHDKFRPVEAFDLAPQAAIAGRIGRIDAFGDDALDMHRAGFVVESRALPDDMVAEMQRRCSICQQRAEPLLALDQRPRLEILAVEIEKIEQE